MEKKNYKAKIEAILFTMGESVELEKIADAKTKALQAIMGHEKISTTIDLYAHSDDDYKTKEIEKVQKYLNIC